jgi:LysM repeat protein
MPQGLTIGLLVLALLLPVVAAIGLRLLSSRLSPLQAYSIAAVFFVITAASTLTLANSNRTTVRIAGLTLLLSDSGAAELPADLLPPVGPAVEVPIDTSATPEETDTSQLPVVPATADAIPTITAIPSTATSVQPSATARSTPTVLPSATPLPPTETPLPPTETPIPPTATPTGPRRYTIQSGDTLRDIAERFGVTVQAILAANRLTPQQADALRPGQEIIIP